MLMVPLRELLIFNGIGSICEHPLFVYSQTKLGKPKMSNTSFSYLWHIFTYTMHFMQVNWVHVQVFIKMEICLSSEYPPRLLWTADKKHSDRHLFVIFIMGSNCQYFSRSFRYFTKLINSRLFYSANSHRPTNQGAGD